MNKSLVKNHAHQNPMCAFLTRHGIGEADQYGRGRWISGDDLYLIGMCIMHDPTSLFVGRYESKTDDWCANGTNRHSVVMLRDFEDLLKSHQ